jgi:hypothetical protein
MRGLLVISGLAFGISKCFGQSDDTIRYYTYAGVSHTLILLGSDDERSGTGFSLARGKNDPKLMLYKKVPGELIWEGYYNESHTNNPTARYPSRTNQAFAVFATARYRWKTRPGVNLYGDGGLGFAVLRHSSQDLPLANDFMIGGGFGAEFLIGTKSSILIGTRYLHTSNAGRVRPNYGENLVQFYAGYSWKY